MKDGGRMEVYCVQYLIVRDQLKVLPQRGTPSSVGRLHGNKLLYVTGSTPTRTLTCAFCGDPILFIYVHKSRRHYSYALLHLSLHTRDLHVVR